MATSLWVVAAGLVLAYSAVSYLIVLSLPSSRYLRHQKWTGIDKKAWMASLKARFATVTDTRNMILEGYKNFSKDHKLFVIPQLSSDPLVILPHELVDDFLSKSDKQVDHRTIGMESLATNWTIGHEFLGEKHFDVVRRQLTRKLPLLTDDVYSELVLAMQDQWKTPASGEWTTVNIYPTCMRIVSRAANRVFSGAELCRDPDYLEHSKLYAQAVFMTGAILKLLPKIVHPIVAPFLVRNVRKHQNICTRLSVPIIEKRQRDMARLGAKYEPPTDVLQWVIDEGLAAGEDMAYKRKPQWISRFLLVLNMVAIHTTSIVTTNTLMDLYCSPEKDDLIAGIRDEVDRNVRDGQWSKEAVNSLIRVDSCIRETMRHAGLGDIGLGRIVQDPAGVDLKDGSHIPYGVRVGMPSHAIHTDGALYNDATRWDGFRFSRPREQYAEETKNGVGEEHLKKVLDLKNQSLITTGSSFLSFGYGRHACPGRFFASQEMKLMVAHIVSVYDIEIEGPRPANMLVNGASVPRDAVEMKIRLRKAHA